MAILLRTLCILPLLFGLAEPFFPFTNPFLSNPFADNPLFTEPAQQQDQVDNNAGNNDVVDEAAAVELKTLFETDYKGSWELVNKNQGVSGMHSALMPNNKIIMYDATSLGPSQLKLNENNPKKCRLEVRNFKYDCWAHSIEYDIKTGKIRPLKLMTDAWCSAGGLDANGVLVSAGGWYDGGRSIRYFTPCENCDWNDKNLTLFTGQRWYSTQAILPDGGFIIVGGRRMFSYEFIPREGFTQTKNYFLPLLDQTTDQDENNLYPFVHLSTDGNLFILANTRSILLNYKNNKVVREFPKIADGPRSYPPSAMSALLPIKLRGKDDPALIPAEVIVCGGSVNGSFFQGDKNKVFLPALSSCGRIVITDPESRWKMEDMPTARVMSDMLILPTGDLLMINGAKRGSSGWECGDEPNFAPHIYRPNKPRGERFIELVPTTIARMYHSSSVLQPDGKILVTGSNPHDGYKFVKVAYPTELRMEKFSPPYLAPELQKHRPEILEAVSDKKLSYGKQFELKFKLANDFGRRMGDINLRMYRPPFTTHGFSMDQRQMLLSLLQVQEISNGNYHVSALAPPSNVIAPPGYYLIFVLHRGVPSTAMWVHLK